MAREIANELKRWVYENHFLLTKPVELFKEERSLKKLVEKPSTKKTELNEHRCVDCGACVSLCLYDALTLDDGKFTFTEENCVMCGLCSDACPVGVKLPPDA